MLRRPVRQPVPFLQVSASGVGDRRPVAPIAIRRWLIDVDIWIAADRSGGRAAWRVPPISLSPPGLAEV